MSYMVTVKESLDVTRCSFYISGDSERIIRCIKVFLSYLKEDGKISNNYPLHDLYHMFQIFAFLRFSGFEQLVNTHSVETSKMCVRNCF